MKRSKAVPAQFVTAYAALVLAGCSNPTQVRRCVDPVTGKMLPDSYCGYSGGGYYGGGYRPVMRGVWGYGGSYDGVRVRGYSSTPRFDADVVSPNGSVISRGVSRSGFGSSGYGSGFG